MQLTLLWLHPWVLPAKPFKFTTRPHSTQRSMHQSARFSKVHNSVKLDVRSSEWDDSHCVTHAWGTLDHNREIKRSKVLKLMHNLRCRSNFTKRVLLLDSSRQNSPKRPCLTKVGDFIGEFYQQINQNFVTLPSLLWKSTFMEYISLCTCTVMQKTACS